MVELLKVAGPQLKRPRSDTLKESDHANMKELRFDPDNGVWRVAYAFDPERKAILLVAGDKSGGSQKNSTRTLSGEPTRGLTNIWLRSRRQRRKT